MELRDHLKRLPEPDPTAPDRVWSRFRRTRRRQRLQRWWPAPVALAAAAAATFAVLAWDPERTADLDARGDARSLHWSDQVELEFAGRGAVSGTDRDVQVDWEQGRIAVQVAPQTGTELTVHTEEAEIRVVGTAFTVTRDRLGVTVSVTHGKVAVDCGDGWSGHLVSDSGDHTCLPLRPALLLGRADALVDRGATVADVLHTVELGLKAAEPHSAVEAELRVRRMHARSETGDRHGALTDADAYLAGTETGREVEVRRFASRLALYDGCERALPYLSALRPAGDPEDHVLLAECLADPADARALLTAALPQLDDTWAQRARTALGNLEGR